MDYCDDGDLYQKIVYHQKNKTNFPEDEVFSILIQMTIGIKNLHDLKILHRDLKSANVFMNKSGLVQLGDLNVSKIAKKGLLYTQTGTPYYASPEVWKDQPYDLKSDIWSFGCVVYEIVALKPPFQAADMDGLYKKVLKGVYPKIPDCYSADVNSLLQSLIKVNPAHRPTCDQILKMDKVKMHMERLGIDPSKTANQSTFNAEALKGI